MLPQTKVMEMEMKGKGSDATGTYQHYALECAKTFLRLCAWLAFGFFTWYTMIYCLPTWSWEWRGTNKPWDKWRSRNTIKYRMDAPDNHDLIAGWDVQTVLLWWFPLLLAAVCSHASELVPVPLTPHKRRRHLFLRSVKQALMWQIPPRRFWVYWCDGLNLAELLGVAVWIITHCVGLWNFIVYYRIGCTERSEIGFRTQVPRSVMYLEWISYTFAWLSFIDFAFLFLPISHNSFLAVLTGLPYAALIRYHRWIGHSAMWMIALHGTFFYMYWIANPYLNFWEEFFDWGHKYYINVFAGTIAFAFGIALWVTSFNFVRRNYFEVFYKTHIIGFIGFITFAILHYGWMWSIFVPGLALYAADYVVRIVQGASVVTAKAVYVSDDGEHVAVMELAASQGFSKCPIQDVFMLFPTISRWQWHPFTIMSRKAGENGSPGTITIGMKAYGNWTKKVIQQLSSRCPVPIRVNGAFDGITLQELAGYDHLVLLGGGIGATPLIALLREIKELKARGDPIITELQQVQFVWVARSSAELSIIPEDIMAMSSSEPWLSLHLHCTAKQFRACMDAEAVKGVKLPDDLGSHTSSSRSNSYNASHVTGAGCTNPFSKASPYFWNDVGPVEPYGDLLHLLVAIVAFIGAFLGLVIGMSSYVEWTDKHYTKDKYWKHGLVVMVCIVVQTIGLPMSLVVLPRYCWLRKKMVACKPREDGPVDLPSAKVQGDGMLGYPEAGLSVHIKPGRPDMQGILQEVAAGGQAKEVCIYCAGPGRMTNEVALLVWDLNDTRQPGQAHVDFKKYAYEL